MKKTLALIISLVMTVCCFSLFSVNADYITEYGIPKADKAPVIDGVITPGEWDGALCVWMGEYSSTWVLNIPGDIAEGSLFYIMWDDTAIYYAVKVIDGTKAANQPASTDELNCGDTVQLAFYCSNDFTDGGGDGDLCLFFDFSPYTSDNHDAPAVYEHFNYSRNITELFNISSVVDVDNYTGYTMEWCITWDMFDKVYQNGFQTQYQPVVGTEIICNLVIIDMDDYEDEPSMYYAFSSDGWCNASATDVFTLSSVTTSQNAKTGELNTPNENLDPSDDTTAGDVTEETTETVADTVTTAEVTTAELTTAKDDVTTKTDASTTAADITTTTETAAGTAVESDKESGCGAVAGGMLAYFILIITGSAVIIKKKH